MGGTRAPADVLDAGSRSARRPLQAIALAVAVVAAMAGTATARSATRPPGVVQLELVGHTGSVLDDEQFLRFWFSVAVHGGSVDVAGVRLVLGDTRADADPPGRVADGDVTQVLVDVVPRCPGAAQALASGTLDVTYRAAGAEHVEHLPLPIDGSLPRLITGRCAPPS